ncbi:MAG: Flp pilus assembly complex ATPase component TadA [Fusobacterium necrophorum]|nr:Flp pilus assembly complex ATPase component TadA [Fusobacterium necrophorum]
MDKEHSSRYQTAKRNIESSLRRLQIYDFLFDNEITEIDINPDNKIFIQRLGKGSINTNLLAKPEDTLNLINILASLESQVINSDNPRISTILPITDARFEGTVPPIVLNPSCTIRKKIIRILSLEDYVNQGILTESHKILIENYVKAKKNILIVGGTNTGKTTFANAILKAMEKDGANERLLFIEDIRELQSNNDNNVFFQIIPTIFNPKDALKSALRYTPDRIIYGEVRGAEAFDLIHAFNSGHKGGICTIHANNCRGGLEKVETYIMYEKDKPLSTLIARTIDVVITMVIEKNERKLDSIAEILGYKNGEYILDFKYSRKTEDTDVEKEPEIFTGKASSFSESMFSSLLKQNTELIETNKVLMEKLLSFQQRIEILERRL